MKLHPVQSHVTLDQISKYVRAIFAMRKSKEADFNASSDYRDYLKPSSSKEEKQSTPIRGNLAQKVAPIVPAPNIPAQNSALISSPMQTLRMSENMANVAERSPLTTAQSKIVQEFLSKLAFQQNQN